MVPPAEFARNLLKEAEDTHPWLHHPLFHMIWKGQLSRDQVRNIIRQQGAFFLDTLRHAAWKIVSAGGAMPTWEDLQRQRSLIPLVVEEGGEDTVGGMQTGHSILFVRLCEALGWTRGHHRGALRWKYRHGVDQRNTRRANGRSAGKPLRSSEIRARLLLRSCARRRGPLRARRAHPNRALRHRIRAKDGAACHAAGDYSTANLRRRIDGGVYREWAEASLEPRFLVEHFGKVERENAVQSP